MSRETQRFNKSPSVESIAYSHGLFCASHPGPVIVMVAVVVILCRYVLVILFNALINAVNWKSINIFKEIPECSISVFTQALSVSQRHGVSINMPTLSVWDYSKHYEKLQTLRREMCSCTIWYCLQFAVLQQEKLNYYTSLCACASRV